MLTHLSLFSGIGGLDLAAEWASFTTVGQCEQAEYPTAVLEKYWPDVPRWRDIKTLTKASFVEKTGLDTVDLISGGFPCQPHSLTGKMRGEEDERNLWPEFLRVIKELRPRYIVGENVVGILSTIHEQICLDLEREGYKVWTFVLPACAFRAPHERYRVAIVGYAESQPGLQAGTKGNAAGEKRQTRTDALRRPWEPLPLLYWATHQPPICGMDDGLSGRLDKSYKERMTALGNAVVPQQFTSIFRAIAKFEGEVKTNDTDSFTTD